MITSRYALGHYFFSADLPRISRIIPCSISNRFFENQPNEICSHLSEKASKGMFLKPD